MGDGGAVRRLQSGRFLLSEKEGMLWNGVRRCHVCTWGPFFFFYLRIQRGQVEAGAGHNADADVVAGGGRERGKEGNKLLNAQKKTKERNWLQGDNVCDGRAFASELTVSQSARAVVYVFRS